MPQSIEEQTLKKLDLILRVVAIQVGADKSLSERVRLLKLAGLDNSTIAQILDTSSDNVKALAYYAKGGKRDKK